MPTAADFADLPSPPPGLVHSAIPPADEHYWDPFWWNQVGRDILSQRHIFDRYTGDEQKEKLAEILEEYPGKSGQIIDTAIEKGEAGVIESMLELGVEIEKEKGLIKGRKNMPSTKEDMAEIGLDGEEDLSEEEEFYPLHAACFQGKFECVKVLVEKGGIDVNSVDDAETTPLTNAAREGSLECVNFLLEHGADPTYEREEGLSIFECAAASGSADVLRALADHSKSVKVGKKVGMKLFETGTESGNVEMITFILERAGLLNSEKDKRHEVLTQEQRRIFEENICRVITRESLESLDLLLSFLTPRDGEGNFEYYKLENEGDTNNVFNASEDAIKNTPVFQRTWEVLLAPPISVLESDPEAKALHYDFLHRRLHSAAGDGALETMKLILEKYKADVNHISHKYHMTSLFAAAAQNHLEVVRTLVEDYNADIHLGSGTYANGPTALHNCIRNGHADVSKLLLRHGGPVEVLENVEGMSVELRDDGKVVIVAYEKYRAPVVVYSEKQWEVIESGKRHFKKVVVDFEGDEDGITNLQIRRSDELLKKEGEGARPLMEENENVDDKSAVEGDRSSKRSRNMDWLERNGMTPR